ncbi:hypothetical protein DRO48_02680 [Candidatus Bathyarchaeota archaeon]|nr:MAG: hypothetical protein DRO48_02680 [Candidatus Bathyarchaeota archaeon]
MSGQVVLQELRLVRKRIERIEKLLEELLERLTEDTLTEDDLEALKEAMQEYRLGQTISLETIKEKEE